MSGTPRANTTSNTAPTSKPAPTTTSTVLGGYTAGFFEGRPSQTNFSSWVSSSSTVFRKLSGMPSSSKGLSGSGAGAPGLMTSAADTRNTAAFCSTSAPEALPHAGQGDFSSAAEG